MTAKPTQPRWKSAVLVAFATLCAAPFVTQSQDYEHTTANGTVRITRYVGPGGDVTIPSTIDSLPVTTIAEAAFANCTTVTTVTIPDTVRNIESGMIIPWGGQYGAFHGCSELTAVSIGNNVTNVGDCTFMNCPKLSSVTFGASITRIGSYAFSHCPLTELRLGNNLVFIGYHAFEGCSSLTNATFGDNLKTIGGYAFAGCNQLRNISLGTRVTSIEPQAFADCTKLEAIDVDPLNLTCSSVDGVLFDKNRTTLIEYPAGKLEPAYQVPDTVITIGDFAFADGCNHLTSITIGKSVTDVGFRAFWGCANLRQISIPDNVITLGLGAFGACSALTNAVIGSGVVCITGRVEGHSAPSAPYSGHSGAFAYCSNLAGITIGKGVTNIQQMAFYQCISLTNATIPANVTSVEAGAFTGCSNLTGVFFESRAPAIVDPTGSSPEQGVFDDSPNVVVYYLPGTTGWGPTFSYRPAVLWNPQFDTGKNSFGGDESGFGLPITGTADIPLVLEATTDISRPAWVPLLSCTLTNGSLELRDPESAVYPNRFYRIRSP